MNETFKESTVKSREPQKKFKRNKSLGWLDYIFGYRKYKEIDNRDNEKITADASKENTQEMLVNLGNLQTLRLDDIAVPKADIIALSDEASFVNGIAMPVDGGITA